MATIPADIDSPRSLPRKGRRAPDTADWGRIVAEGRAARLGADKGRWRIGALALLVEKRYGMRNLAGFAEEIGESYATVRRYRWVVKRYDPTIRFRFANLSFSHFQAVAGRDDRVKWLERAEQGCWSVDRLARQSRPKASRPSRRPRKRDRVRVAVQSAATSIRQIADLDDDAIARTDAKWLARTLAELAAEVERIRERVRAATGKKAPLRVARYASNGNGRPRAARR